MTLSWFYGLEENGKCIANVQFSSRCEWRERVILKAQRRWRGSIASRLLCVWHTECCKLQYLNLVFLRNSCVSWAAVVIIFAFFSIFFLLLLLYVVFHAPEFYIFYKIVIGRSVVALPSGCRMWCAFLNAQNLIYIRPFIPGMWQWHTHTHKPYWRPLYALSTSRSPLPPPPL